jgi:predicted acyltransferase
MRLDGGKKGNKYWHAHAHGAMSVTITKIVFFFFLLYHDSSLPFRMSSRVEIMIFLKKSIWFWNFYFV